MSTTSIDRDVAREVAPLMNGAAMAAFVAAGAGAFAMGLVVLLHEVGVYSAPALHGGAGGVSGRTTFAVVAWLVVWLALHLAWRRRDIPPRRALAITLVLTMLGVLGTFPPFWSVF
jgi:hypothetical protein